jgi:hypothetical protein
MINKTEKILFRFSSYEHPGCRVVVQGNVIDHVEVTAARDEHTVHAAGTANCYDEKGPTKVYGRVQGKNLPANMDKPFAIEIRAYSPVDNVNYRMDVIGSWIVDYDSNNVVEFVGALLRPWYNAKTGETLPTPRLNNTGTTQTFLDGPRKVPREKADASYKNILGVAEAAIGPWPTVRACIDCGALIAGGPTRCGYCVDKAGGRK